MIKPCVSIQSSKYVLPSASRLILAPVSDMFHDEVENRSVVRVVVGVVDVDGVDVVGKVVKKSDVGLKSVDCD